MKKAISEIFNSPLTIRKKELFELSIEEKAKLATSINMELIANSKMHNICQRGIMSGWSIGDKDPLTVGSILVYGFNGDNFESIDQDEDVAEEMSLAYENAVLSRLSENEKLFLKLHDDCPFAREGIALECGYQYLTQDTEENFGERFASHTRDEIVNPHYSNGSILWSHGKKDCPHRALCNSMRFKRGFITMETDEAKITALALNLRIYLEINAINYRRRPIIISSPNLLSKIKYILKQTLGEKYSYGRVYDGTDITFCSCDEVSEISYRTYAFVAFVEDEQYPEHVVPAEIAEKFNAHFMLLITDPAHRGDGYAEKYFGEELFSSRKFKEALALAENRKEQ